MPIERSFFAAAFACCLVTLSLAASKPAHADPALPGEPCGVPPRDIWTEPEAWAWKRICEGETADFPVRTGVILDPRKSEGWSDDRTLSSEFLETVLLYEPYRNALTHRGVRIVGAWFPEPINLENARITTELRLEASRFEKQLSLRSMRTDGLLSLVGSDFEDYLNMDKINVAEDLFMDGGATFKDVDLTGARVGGQISMAGSRFTDKLNMESVEVGQLLLMYKRAEFKEVVLRSAKIGGQISMENSTFAGMLDMESAEIGRSVFAMGSTFERGAAWSLIFAKIRSNLVLSGATMTDLDLTGASIEGELSLGGANGFGPTHWADGSELILRNTKVGALQGQPDAWPETLALEGLTYQRLGRFGAEGMADTAQRENAWFINWLARDRAYSPQPYEQLAGVLRDGGQAGKADDALYAGRERERTEVATGLDFVWKTALHAFIGHGYRVHRALYWILGFVVLGAIVLRVSGEGQRNKMPIGLSYSLDTLIPIVRLREYHYSHVDLAGWARYYFYFHQIMGYVLASFLIAGLAGLTK